MQELNLNGKWNFALLKEIPEDIESIKPDLEIDVPACVEQFYPQVTKEQFYFFYEKEFYFDPKPGKRYFIAFGAVDYLCKVFFNGVYLGENEGGCLPFEFEVTDILKSLNKIQVLVFDPISCEVIDFREIPHGKQNGDPNWYTNISGIWQGVVLKEKPEVFISSLKIRTSFLRKTLSIDFETTNSFDRGSIILKKGKDMIFSSEIDKAGSFDLEIKNILPWSPDSPILYDLEIRIEKDSELFVEKRKIGFRDFETKNGKLLLNGEDFYMLAVLDQDFYPEKLYTLPSREYLENSFKKLKTMGINTLRCHVKVPDPIYMELADKIGLIVWQDSPYFDKFSEKAANRLIQTIKGTLDRDTHHPSLCIYSIINESWGIDESDEDQINWLEKTFDELKILYPGIVFVDNSACIGNYHVKTDINDYHFYINAIDRIDYWNWLIDLFVSKPDSTFLKGHEKKANGKPLIVSEFGNWTVPPEKWLKKTPEPYWFKYAFNGLQMTKPMGALERFKKSSLAKEFSLEAFFRISVENQLENLRLEINKMKSHREIRGFVITELADTFWECNGLLDFDRNYKFDPFIMKKILTNDVFIPNLSKYAIWRGEEILLTLFLLKDIPEGVLTVTSNQETILRKSIKGEADETVSFEFNTSDLGEGMHKINVQVEIMDEIIISDLPLLISERSKQEIRIVHSMDENFLSAAKNGELIVVAPEKPGTVINFENYNAKIVQKDGFLTGDWVSSISWLVKDFDVIAPHHTFNQAHQSLLKNRPLIKSSGFVRRLSGVTYGWFSNFHSYIDLIEIGKGKIIVTTLNVDTETPAGNLLLKEFIRNY